MIAAGGAVVFLVVVIGALLLFAPKPEKREANYGGLALLGLLLVVPGVGHAIDEEVALVLPERLHRLVVRALATAGHRDQAQQEQAQPWSGSAAFAVLASTEEVS